MGAEEADYPCDFPPSAVIKGIVSGEEVVAGDKSPRFALLRSHFNDCGAVEMEGWGVMNAAHHEKTPAIIVRGISDMCAGKITQETSWISRLRRPMPPRSRSASSLFGARCRRRKVPCWRESKKPPPEIR